MHEHKPSGTAYLIAGSLAASGNDPVLSQLLPPKGSVLGEWVITDTLGNGRLLLWALKQGWGRGIVRVIERNVLPGIQAHYIVRKRYIEDAVRATLQLESNEFASQPIVDMNDNTPPPIPDPRRFRQVVNVGAGFDSLCWRLHTEYPSVRFLEIDHPSTQREKRNVLENHGDLRSNLNLYAADLTTADLETVLRECPQFDPQLPTAFIVEGLTMYLTEVEIAGLFSSMLRINLPGTKVIFTFMEPQTDGRVNFPQASKVVAWWLRHRGENFKWGIPRGSLRDYLSVQGFDLAELVAEADLRRLYMNDPALAHVPLAVGELICVAEAEAITRS